MERNLMQEFEAKLSLISLERPEDNYEFQLKPFFEDTCCNNTMIIECSEHFLNNTLMYNLHENLKSEDLNLIFSTALFIAEMAKYEISREYLSNVYLVCLLVDKVKREKEINIRIETCRALSNMCYEHPKSQRLIIGQHPLEVLFALLNRSSLPQKKDSNERFKEVLIALILNLLADNERVLQQIADKYMPILLRTLEYDLKNRIPTPISHNIFVAIVALTEVKPPEIIFSLKLCLSVVDMFRRTPVYDYAIPGLEFLQDSELPDITKYQLTEAGLFDVFMWNLEHKPQQLLEEERRRFEMLGRILANILSGDEAMSFIYDINNAQIINRFNTWLLSRDKEIIHVGALCLGNIARSDSNSVTIVRRGIHRQLITVARANKRDVRVVYAAVSAMRNLCVARENRKILIEDGMLDVLLPLLDLEVRTSSPVIYKAVGAIRQVIEDNEDIALRLGHNIILIRQLVSWSTATLLPWVSSECSRLLCSLVNITKSRDVIMYLLENGAYPQIARTLVALHGAMQSEALICMTVTINAALEESERIDFEELSVLERRKSRMLSNFYSVLLECQIADKLKYLMAHHGGKMEQKVVQDCLTFVEHIIKIEQLRMNLHYEGFTDVFENVMRSRADFQQIRARVEHMVAICRGH